MTRLLELRVRYVLVHQAFYQHDEYAELMSAIAQRPEFSAAGRYRDWVNGETQIFELRR